MVKKILVAAAFLFIIVSSFAQSKTTTHLEQVWLGFFNHIRYSNHWGSWVDVHLRTRENFFTNFSQSVLRVGITYYLADDTRLTAGYAYFSFYPDGQRTVTQPEHRLWQQIRWLTSYKKIRTIQHIRLEERYRRKLASNDQLGEGYSFNFRARYSFLLQVPLNKGGIKPNSFSFITNNEIMVNFGKEIVNNYFDQNRFFIGFAYQVNRNDNIQFGYMNLFQQLPAGNQYRSIHALRLSYLQNLDLRKK